MPKRKVRSLQIMNSVESLTPYQAFTQRWKDCTACHLCERRRHVVLARGYVPCDVLFIGEAPGESEDILSQPFVGPAGILLDKIVAQATVRWQVPGTEGPDYNSVQCCFSNLVCCIPRGDDGRKTSEPDDDAIEACSVRLVEFMGLASPRLIVTVGNLPKVWLGSKWLPIPLDNTRQTIPVCGIMHPAYILRVNVAQKGLLIQRAIVTLENAIEEFVGS